MSIIKSGKIGSVNALVRASTGIYEQTSMCRTRVPTMSFDAMTLAHCGHSCPRQWVWGRLV
eukprot:scaffold600603_cov16-Prasinocladus_malaysianus.AAC.1